MIETMARPQTSAITFEGIRIIVQGFDPDTFTAALRRARHERLTVERGRTAGTWSVGNARGSEYVASSTGCTCMDP